MVGRGDTRKAFANKAGVEGRHGVRPDQTGRFAGRRETLYGKSSGVQGEKGGCDSSRVAHESLGVGDEEGGREASRVAETRRGTTREWWGGSSRHRASTPPERQSFPRGTKTSD